MGYDVVTDPCGVGFPKRNRQRYALLDDERTPCGM